eukprot:550668-Rhodomonas_salina.1
MGAGGTKAASSYALAQYGAVPELAVGLGVVEQEAVGAYASSVPDVAAQRSARGAGGLVAAYARSVPHIAYWRYRPIQ